MRELGMAGRELAVAGRELLMAVWPPAKAVREVSVGGRRGGETASFPAAFTVMSARAKLISCGLEYLRRGGVANPKLKRRRARPEKGCACGNARFLGV